jgi:hypothetical protein
VALQEALMKGHPFPETHCVICSKLVDLSADLAADENGKKPFPQNATLSESRSYRAAHRSL